MTIHPYPSEMKMQQGASERRVYKREAHTQVTSNDAASSFPMGIDKNDALLIVDVQNDFLPGGNLAVPKGNEVIDPINHFIRIFESRNLPIFFTRDWHPKLHCSFSANKGIWPSHCVQNSVGAQFPAELYMPKVSRIISKATAIEKDAYSGFEGTDLHTQLQSLKISRLFIGGLATEYCVLSTVKDACQLDYEVYVLKDGIKAVNVKSEDEHNAIEEMKSLGVVFI